VARVRIALGRVGLIGGRSASRAKGQAAGRATIRALHEEEHIVRKGLMISALVVALVALGIFAFREPIMGAVVERLTRDMFVAADTDAFDPGVPVGSALPSIRARMADREVTDIGALMGERGAVLIANRSVDW
jgi:hypothetical protein